MCQWKQHTGVFIWRTTVFGSSKTHNLITINNIVVRNFATRRRRIDTTAVVRAFAM